MTIERKGRVEGKVCLVTGGAMGLGEAMAKMLAREGGRVVLTDLAQAQGETVARAIVDAGGEAMFLMHDVTSEAQWESVTGAALERFGRIDVLVNNAGIGSRCAPDEQSLEGWRQILSVNLDGVFLGTRQALRAMKRNGPAGGSIINISSIEGLIGDPSLGAYNASKGGVTIYTRSVALWCAQQRTGIRVNSIHPGYIRTPLVEASVRALGDVEEGLKALGAMHPVGHVGEPDDIAYGVVYLASDESRFMTGSALVIDGGYTAQ